MITADQKQEIRLKIIHATGTDIGEVHPELFIHMDTPLYNLNGLTPTKLKPWPVSLVIMKDVSGVFKRLGQFTMN